jgi:hypothetical protein
MALNDPATDRQANAGARVLSLRVQSGEHLKDLLQLTSLDPNPLVLHGDHPIALSPGSGNVNPRRSIPVVDERVANEVL